LKKRLEAEGLFDARRKKPLPAAAESYRIDHFADGRCQWRDVVRILKRRFHNVHLTLYPVRVQGEGSAAEIVACAGLLQQEAARGCDAAGAWRRLAGRFVVVQRGERGARHCGHQQFSKFQAVGHETDFTIADFVADMRASTPSAAAELVVQTRREFDKHVMDLRARLEGSLRYRLLELSRRVHALTARSGFRRPQDLLRQQRQRADEFTARLAFGIAGAARRFAQAPEQRAPARSVLRFSRQNWGLAIAPPATHPRNWARAKNVCCALKRERWERLTLQLQERSPLKVLERGYAIAPTPPERSYVTPTRSKSAIRSPFNFIEAIDF